MSVDRCSEPHLRGHATRSCLVSWSGRQTQCLRVVVRAQADPSWNHRCANSVGYIILCTGQAFRQHGWPFPPQAPGTTAPGKLQSTAAFCLCGHATHSNTPGTNSNLTHSPQFSARARRRFCQARTLRDFRQLGLLRPEAEVSPRTGLVATLLARPGIVPTASGIGDKRDTAKPSKTTEKLRRSRVA
eukprot:CAMPEP_0204440552 /NCGR_PEP_ID=MMETSP0470-20130426/83498_1 /ASSEMBLY_ACC=CAM_ASM_000385 /TAXON_ID=2969 /ORGANISM="Oxyrrhis marina" /LENGTH=186 /DNA_ID=CAMNT_0051439569 /DNA_START=64 /DNA_END=625 /DNA_ORIENTATION=+